MRTVMFILLSFLLLLTGGCLNLENTKEYNKITIEEQENNVEGTTLNGSPVSESKETNLYDDSVLAHLGKSKKEIVELYGEPDCDGPIGGPGGIFLLYEDLGISFICAGDGSVVNNLEVFPGTEILGVKVGMTFDEIEEIWGTSKWREYDELNNCYTSCYWMGEIREEECLGELELYFFTSSDKAPTEILGVYWKKFWW